MILSTLEAIHQRHKELQEGRVADYIPALGEADPGHFGIAVVTADGQTYTVGDTDVPFTIQSISKPLSFALALETCGAEETYRHVGTEPTGDSFNAINFDEATKRPFNPMVNAGAIAMSALIHDNCGADPFEKIRSTYSRLAGRDLDWAVDVGLPAKSGVSGGIMAVVNRQIGIGIFSPPLDAYGNSVRGIKACVDLAEEFGLHAFEFTNAGGGLLKAYL